jgi:asparagine synthase (glutamine-hydrolysing)
MCGICGWVNFRSLIHTGQAIVADMNATLGHRGPDDAGAVTLGQSALAMSRLSIIDVATGHQPVANENETCWIVFNGEIYNFLDLRRDLEARGHRFHTRSDTEVVLHAYEEWGPGCVQRLRGMFAFAIEDRRTHAGCSHGNGVLREPKLFLARDRVGKKPLYYYHDANCFVFGSELKAILAHPDVPRRVNCPAIPLYLTYGYVPAPQTMFEGVLELPPGHTLTVQGEQVTVRQYWDHDERSTTETSMTEGECVERLRELLEDAVRVRLVSEAPLGAFLSGGLDSTLIVALMTRILDQPVKTFAIGFVDDPSFNELEYARLAARTYGAQHHEFIVRPDAIELLPTLVWHYDQPFADSSAIATYLVAKLTGEYVTVALTGDGGDELFTGYERFAAARLAEYYCRTPRLLQIALARLMQTLPESTSYHGFARRVRRFVEHAALPLPQRYLGWVGIFPIDFLHPLLTDEMRVDPLGHFLAYFDQVANRESIEQLLSVNARTYLPGDLLVKTDRMTIANSLEARCPFLDQELLEFAARIPLELKLKGLTTKYILKKAAESLVPRDIIHRKKHGFGVPVGRWFRTSLKDYIRDVLLSPQTLCRGYFRENAVRRLLEEHQTGKRDHGHRLWALLTFEIWHRVFIDQKGVPPCQQIVTAESKFSASLRV